MRPADRSRALVDAYNRRDAEAIRAMLHPAITYVRPGPRAVPDHDAIVRLYEADWDRNDATLEIRSTMEDADRVLVELTITVPGADQPIEGCAVHRWADGLLAEYRAYLDPFPR